MARELSPYREKVYETHRVLSFSNKRKLNATSLTLKLLLLIPVRKFVPITTHSEMGVFPNTPFNAVCSLLSHFLGVFTV